MAIILVAFSPIDGGRGDVEAGCERNLLPCPAQPECRPGRRSQQRRTRTRPTSSGCLHRRQQTHHLIAAPTSSRSLPKRSGTIQPLGPARVSAVHEAGRDDEDSFTSLSRRGGARTESRVREERTSVSRRPPERQRLPMRAWPSRSDNNHACAMMIDRAQKKTAQPRDCRGAGPWNCRRSPGRAQVNRGSHVPVQQQKDSLTLGRPSVRALATAGSCLQDGVSIDSEPSPPRPAQQCA